MTVSPVRMAKIIKFHIFRSSLFRLFHWPDVNGEVCFDKESEMDNYVTFLVPPVFSSRPSSSVSVPSIRESLRVSCSARGSPLPTVTWYKNDIRVPVINNVTADEFTSELVIGEFLPADQDTYRCVASNVYNDTVETSTRICKSKLFTFS